jgi:betaine-aldehyde dehydrogenase
MNNERRETIDQRELVAAIPRELYYAGGWHPAADGSRAEIWSPSTGQSLGRAAWAGAEDVDRAVRAAHAAFYQWRAVKPLERARILREVAALLRRHGRELALIDAADCGNPIAEMINDSAIGAASVEYFAGLVTELRGSTIPMGPGVLNYTVREPLGVIARINAFNHPLLFAAMRTGAPLASGNTLIVKPPEQAPLSSLRFAELVGPLFPAGVFSVLPGGRECGSALTAHPLIAKVGLIGSVPTGKAIMRASADTLKKVALELGGKNALIAYPDADPDRVAAGIIRGMNFTWCGQSCGSTSRAFLHDAIHDAVLERVAAAARAIRPGIPTEQSTAMGSLISKDQFDKVMRYIGYGIEEGARLVAGGKPPQDPHLGNGFFIEPTIFAEVTPQMRIAREEIFGPVLCVFRWSNEAEMLHAVNNVEYGLTASIWTRDLGTAHRVAALIEAGYVWINSSSAHYLAAPFGGYKQSGIGREESIEELMDSTQIKNVHVEFDA